jgi:hypothetical protein
MCVYVLYILYILRFTFLYILYFQLMLFISHTAHSEQCYFIPYGRKFIHKCVNTYLYFVIVHASLATCLTHILGGPSTLDNGQILTETCRVLTFNDILKD